MKSVGSMAAWIANAERELQEARARNDAAALAHVRRCDEIQRLIDRCVAEFNRPWLHLAADIHATRRRK